ncbi:MAG: site-specific DNA-methyltransferase [Bdellovibrio sp.]
MSKNKQQDPQQTLKVENYEFEPIKGYPMLNWKGKRPFTSTQYFPAQLKESYGKPDANGWMNKIFWGDNLQVMSHLLKEYRGKVRLIYIDPPYDSKADYKKTIKLRNKEAIGDHSGFEEKQYSDIWSNDEYLQFMYERLLLMKELLTDDGSVFVHCDYRKSHHFRCIMDEVFGEQNFVNEIIWKSTSFTGSSKTIANKFPVNHNTIYWYCKKSYIFNKPRLDYSEEYLKRFSNPDNDPNGPWQSVSLKTYSDETFQRLKKEGALIAPQKKGAGWRYKFYLKDAKGKVLETLWNDENSGSLFFKYYLTNAETGDFVSTIWADINMENSMASGRTGYPTQKPEALLDRIIKATSNEGDIVFDCFMGSGTAQVVAMNNNRKFIGADINVGSIRTTTKRLAQIRDQVERVGFQVFTVNQFELFKNPVEAKELLLSSLEINKISNSVFDGEKDGRLVKIMPINRIASKGDLGDLIAGLDYKIFEKRQKESPNRPVEKILLVCMGHEPDLKANLEKDVRYKVDIEIVDILRDRQELQFKRDSEAKVKIKKEKLVIEKFYPMNLLQKLSLQKEKVSDWKELVESVLIDWNYDGAVLEPQVIDIPEKNELVVGEYDVPKDAGTIRVKITDLLSESIEIEVGRE